MRFKLLMGVVVLAALSAGVWFGQMLHDPPGTQPETSAIILNAPRDPGDFQLVRHDGEAFLPADLKGGWVLWFFGFTHCPDVCPMTLAALNLTDQMLSESGSIRPTVLMVSVDPARDTPEKLANYVPFFNPGFVGVTGTAGEIRQLTERLGIIVQYVATSGQDYTVDHSATLLLTGPDGLVRAVFQSPHEPRELADDLASLIPWLEGRL